MIKCVWEFQVHTMYCLGCNRPRRTVTIIVLRALEAYLLTYCVTLAALMPTSLVQWLQPQPEKWVQWVGHIQKNQSSSKFSTFLIVLLSSKLDYRQGCVPDPAWGAYSSSQTSRRWITGAASRHERGTERGEEAAKGGRDLHPEKKRKNDAYGWSGGR